MNHLYRAIAYQACFEDCHSGEDSALIRKRHGDLQVKILWLGYLVERIWNHDIPSNLMATAARELVVTEEL